MQQRVMLTSGWNELTYIVNQKPMRAEIDRDQLFFDKNMEDNGKKVTLE